MYAGMLDKNLDLNSSLFLMFMTLYPLYVDFKSSLKIIFKE